MLVTAFLWEGQWFRGSFSMKDGRAMVHVHDGGPGVWPVGLAFWAGHGPWAELVEVVDD